MQIFSSKTNYIEFFLKIGKKCPTSCSHCHYANSRLDFFDAENIKKRIRYGENLFLDKDFIYFLYGIDFWEHPEKEILLDIVHATGRNFKIQLGLGNIPAKLEWLKTLYAKYGFFEVTIANEVNTKEDIKSIFEALHVFSELKYLRFNFDIITDTQKNGVFVSHLKRLFGAYRKDSVHKNLTFPDRGNINLGIGEKFYIDADKREIRNVSYEACVMKELFDIREGVIYFNDHLELDYKGYFRLHTPLCFLSYIKIAHMNDTPSEIRKKFTQFKKDVSGVHGNMGKKCFECLKNNYPV